MKGVIAATNLCFAEKAIYTSEVLAIVLTQLLEVSRDPFLLVSSLGQSDSVIAGAVIGCGWVRKLVNYAAPHPSHPRIVPGTESIGINGHFGPPMEKNIM